MKKLEKALRRYLDEALEFMYLPGLAVSLVMRDNRGRRLLDFKETLGYRNYETKEKLGSRDCFHMASVSKLFTSTAIIKLCCQGKLSVKDKISDVLPWFQIEDLGFKNITVGSMLSHTSGMADVKDYHWQQARTDKEALKDYCTSEEVRNSFLLWSPSEKRFSYSNMAYEVLGALVAEISGMSFEDYIDSTLLKPLQMNNSTFLTFKRAETLDIGLMGNEGIAAPHVKDKDKHIKVLSYYPYNREHGPSSTLTSDIEDMDRWAEAHLNKAILMPEVYHEIWDECTKVPNNREGMGLGWFIRRQGGYTLYGHEGTDDGFRASFWICPALNANITVVSNISGARVKKINKKLFDIVLENKKCE